ncbi:MAG: hypothetical protein KDD04_02265, partial [Sinomicrobium sp.]|nr:hypothetical protein [Sinomicrobium sp.]
MLLKRTDVEEKLRHYRNKTVPPDAILAQVNAILNAETQYEKMEDALTHGSAVAENDFDIDLLATDRIYHITQIKKICIDYRLRFLDSRYFKGKYPKQTLVRIEAMEKEHGIAIKGFKIIAPSRLFKLDNADDPLLFAPIGNDYYYLIHKWGKDLHPLRKWFMLPFRNFLNLVILVAFLSWVFAALLPMGLFSKQNDASHFWLLYLFIFK